MQKSLVVHAVAVCLLAGAVPSGADTLRGGGSKRTDCMVVFDVPGANKPAPPKTPRSVDCTDGDPTCDDDGIRNGECVFPLQVCVNSTAFAADCTPDTASFIEVAHAIDDGLDPKFDTDFQALQSRADGLGLPSMGADQCSLSSAITVRLKGPSPSNNKMRPNRKKLLVTSDGSTVDGIKRDRDRIKFKCRPEGDKVYLPTDLYEGTFDRIRTQVFAQSCAVAACHDSEGNQGGLILLSGAAYGNIVGVTPMNAAAAGDGLDRITPGDEDLSFLYRKINNDLAPGYGGPMPASGPLLDPALVELIRLWILGDGTLGPAPETGWVVGTDQ